MVQRKLKLVVSNKSKEEIRELTILYYNLIYSDQPDPKQSLKDFFGIFSILIGMILLMTFFGSLILILIGEEMTK
jgi:hypothetical protein